MITIESADAVLIQDAGRRDLADQGVPRSGAWDLERYEHACALVGAPDAPVFEILAGRFAARFDRETTVAAVGEFASGALAHAFTVPAGGEVSLVAGRGPAYVAVAGLAVEPVLGSFASDLVSMIGPARIRAGDCFATGAARGAAQIVAAAPTASIGYVGDHLPAEWQVVSQSRSGTRITPRSGWQVTISASLPSRPMLAGAIQVVSTQEAIILGPDSGVTGGYQVAGVIATADLSRMARLQEGESFTVESISLDEAVRRYERMASYRVVRLP
jgi:allophanate hydrolase subunit 2